MVGQVQEFQAVPGCGLKCRVTHLCNMMDPDMCDADVLIRQNSTSSFHVTIDGVVMADESTIKFGDKLGEYFTLLCKHFYKGHAYAVFHLKVNNFSLYTRAISEVFYFHIKNILKTYILCTTCIEPCCSSFCNVNKVDVYTIICSLPTLL